MGIKDVGFIKIIIFNWDYLFLHIIVFNCGKIVIFFSGRRHFKIFDQKFLEEIPIRKHGSPWKHTWEKIYEKKKKINLSVNKSLKKKDFLPKSSLKICVLELIFLNKKIDFSYVVLEIYTILAKISFKTCS